MQKISEKWLERAGYDLKTAEAMLNARRYLYVAFMCQQALEKILKAIIAENGGNILRTHNLVRLAELAEVYSEINEDGRDFLADLTPFAIEARYGDYRSKLSEIVNRKKAQDYLDKTKKVYKWLVKKVKK